MRPTHLTEAAAASHHLAATGKHKNPAVAAPQYSAPAFGLYPPPHYADSPPVPNPAPRDLHSSSRTQPAEAPPRPAPQNSAAVPPPSASPQRRSAALTESSAHYS